MGAQLVSEVKEIVFTSDDDSVLITLCDGRTIELHGDGLIEVARSGDQGLEAVDALVCSCLTSTT